ncbi:MAG: hypothetical protein OHK0028_17960 [Deltaproteobacteria bacterium]
MFGVQYPETIMTVVRVYPILVCIVTERANVRDEVGHGRRNAGPIPSARRHT